MIKELIELLEELGHTYTCCDSGKKECICAYDKLYNALKNSVLLTKEQAICIRDWDESANFENVMSEIDKQISEMEK